MSHFPDLKFEDQELCQEINKTFITSGKLHSVIQKC